MMARTPVCPLATFAALAGSWLVGCEQVAVLGVVAPEGSTGESGPRDASAQDGEAGAIDAGDTGHRDGDTADGASPDRDAAACSVQVDTCDPVTNRGCSMALAQQCAPDLTAGTLAGYCTFVGPLMDGGLECLNSVVTESCPPGYTCVNNACRDLCYCDADCEAGSCCSEPLGDKGFFVCAPC